MSQPTFLSDGDTPRRTDSRWFRWCKILGAFQNKPRANPKWNPRRNDTLRDLQRKVQGATDEQAIPNDSCLIVAGTGVSAIDGTYTLDDPQADPDVPVYHNAQMSVLYLSEADNFWILSTDVVGHQYQSVTSDKTGAWTVTLGGGNPPNVSLC